MIILLVNVKDFESLSSHVKLGFNEFWEQSLSMWTNNSLERKDLEVKHDDPYHTTFVWKKVLPNNPIKVLMCFCFNCSLTMILIL